MDSSHSQRLNGGKLLGGVQDVVNRDTLNTFRYRG